MVHPKAGSYGAVAQNARKRQKETTGSKNQMKKPPPPTPAGKKVKGKMKSNERVQSAEDVRKQNEILLLEKELANGEDISNLDVNKFERLLDSMQQDEKTEEDIPDDEAKNDKKSEIQSMTHKRMLQKYKIDREDYMLQYADAHERPILYEEYQPKFHPCLYMVEVREIHVDLIDASEQMLEYAIELIGSYNPPIPNHFPTLLLQTNSYRSDATEVNMCVNPLQILRGWALLSNIAKSKTFDELTRFINQYSSGKFASSEAINNQLLSLHIEAEDLFDGCVRLFTEIPHHLPHNDDIRRNMNLLYGGKSKRAAIQHHCFATDSDGLYSCYRINKEVSLSTRGAVHYVVPENSAPNWRASLCLVSAMSCKFFLKICEDEKFIDSPYFTFTHPKGVSVCSGVLATAVFRMEDHIYRFDSHQEGVHLFIIRDRENEKKTFDKAMLKKINSSDNWNVLRKRVMVPKATVSNPMSLFEHSKHNGLSRLFSSEKSELQEMKSSELNDGQSPQFMTLFDHYHKTSFEIVATKTAARNSKRQFDEFSSDRAHQSIDDSISKHFGKFQIKDDRLDDLLFTYYEDHLDRNPAQFSSVTETFPIINIPEPNEVVNFGEPFFFIMTRRIKEKPFVVCAGYFNNSIWKSQS